MKIKTIKSVKKRIKKNSNNKLKFKHTNLRHILTKKSSKRKRKLRKKNIVNKTNKKILIKSIPYL